VDSYWLEFLKTLPLELRVLGQIIRLRERAGQQVGVKVSPDPAPPNPLEDCPGFVFFGTLHLTLSTDEVLGFLAYSLKTPFGPRLLTLGSNATVNKRRLFVFRAAMLSWVQLNGPRDKEGRLEKAVSCIHLITEQTQTQYRIRGCSNRTKDPCGLCHHHNRPGALTLLNEGVLEYISIVEASEAQWAAKAKEADEQRYAERRKRQEELDAERQRREDKWKSTAATIHYTATDRQIHLLLDLGAGVHELEGTTKEAATVMIDSILDKLHSGQKTGQV
jgi:hypothetical protein